MNYRHWLNEIGLERALLQLSPKDYLTLRQLFEGVIMFGQTGSGKSSGPLATLAVLLIRLGIGIIVFTTKNGEAEEWRRYAKLAGAENRLRIFGEGRRLGINPLHYSFHCKSARGTGITDNVIALLMQLLEIKDRGRSNSGEQQFWIDMSKLTLGAGIDLLALAGETISFANIYKLLNSSATSSEEVQDSHWQANSYLNGLINRATKRTDLTERQQNDLLAAIDSWLLHYPRYDERLRSGLMATISSLLYPFTRGILPELFGGETNINPEDIFRGSIVVIDLPIKEYMEAGLFGQMIWKTLFMRAAEGRNLTTFPAPVAMICDEYQNYLTSVDPLYVATSRSQRIINICATQNIDSVISRFSQHTGRAEAESLFGNFGTKIFCANDHVGTNDWAAQLLGKEWETRMTTNTSLGNDGQTSAGTNEQQRFLFEPSHFKKLAKGGLPSNIVQTLLFRSGIPFAANGLNHLFVDFSQELK